MSYHASLSLCSTWFSLHLHALAKQMCRSACALLERAYTRVARLACLKLTYSVLILKGLACASHAWRSCLHACMHMCMFSDVFAILCMQPCFSMLSKPAFMTCMSFPAAHSVVCLSHWLLATSLQHGTAGLSSGMSLVA